MTVPFAHSRASDSQADSVSAAARVEVVRSVLDTEYDSNGGLTPEIRPNRIATSATGVSATQFRLECASCHNRNSSRPTACPIMTGRALVAWGSADNITTFSGTPYHLLNAGRRAGFLQYGVQLDWPRWWRAGRLAWNGLSPFRLEGPGGFMLRTQSLEALWRRRRPLQSTSEWLSTTPLLPPHSSTTQPVSYYIDITLKQGIEEYGYRAGHRTRRAALTREKEAYEAAGRVVCLSHWCAASVIRDYGIDPAKVLVIHPGANLDDANVPPQTKWDGNLSPLRLGFVGVNAERKGLSELLAVATLLAARGRRVEVIVIGPDPSVLPRHEALRPLGFISKSNDVHRFVETLQTFHFGCLLSKVDASPISITESLRLGIPVIASDVGGIPELVPADAGIVVPLEGAAQRIADELDRIIAEPERYLALRSAAAEAAEHFTWRRAVREFQAVFGEA